MIIARITSGLGNQLFQYALARHLALRNRTGLYVDLSYYRQTHATDTPRAFRLHQFNTDYRVLHQSPYQYASKATRLLPSRTLRPLVHFVQEGQFDFDDRVLDASARLITLDGFWQSERYFADCADVIRRELTFKHPLEGTAASYQRAIERAAVPVSVHIRRGDYVHHPEFSKTFGFVGLDYYRAALDHLSAQFPALKLFIFSDDAPWVRAHLAPDVPHVYITNTGGNADLDDLHLMSLCRHHVIANSSYSWWGAWLDPRPDKVVIAPKAWFRHKPDANTKDLVPATWLRL